MKFEDFAKTKGFLLRSDLHNLKAPSATINGNIVDMTFIYYKI